MPDEATYITDLVRPITRNETSLFATCTPLTARVRQLGSHAWTHAKILPDRVTPRPNTLRRPPDFQVRASPVPVTPTRRDATALVRPALVAVVVPCPRLSAPSEGEVIALCGSSHGRRTGQWRQLRRRVRDLCWLEPYRSGASFFCVRPELWRVGWHGSGCDLRSVLRSGVSWYGGRG